MAALSADLELEMKDAGKVIAVPMVLSKTIYKGSMVSIVGASGLAQASADSASDDFIGIALEQKTSAASGTTYIRVYTGGVFRLALSSIEAADVGKIVYVSDDHTVTDGTAAVNNIGVGLLVERISATEGWVAINERVVGTAST